MYLIVKVHFMGKEELYCCCSGTAVFKILVGGHAKYKSLRVNVLTYLLAGASYRLGPLVCFQNFCYIVVLCYIKWICSGSRM